MVLHRHSFVAKRLSDVGRPGAEHSTTDTPADALAALSDLCSSDNARALALRRDPRGPHRVFGLLSSAVFIGPRGGGPEIAL